MTSAHRTSSNSVVIFAGPSYPASFRVRADGVEWRGPAAAGDMLPFLAAPPRCIVLIDGLFDQRPSVRHKELLLLLAKGVHVVGGASMGALRAAELCSFGMVGVGRVYRAYAEGRLHRDDEVALLHGPEALDWPPFTLPLVNVRATLTAAVRCRVLSAAAARRLLRLAADVFYQERTWEGLLSRTWAAAADLGEDVERLGQWLPAGAVDIKRLDAIACVKAAMQRAHLAGPLRPEPPDTVFTRELMRAVGAKL